MVQVDLITGFLGAGKTTFLRRYVRYLVQQGHKVCILENDFGAVNVDAMLVQEVLGPGCDVETISGGCDCDTHQRRMRTKLIAMAMRGFDRVVVILTRDKSYVKKPMNPKPIDLWYKHYPALAEQLKNRHNVYNNALRELLNWEQQGKAWVLHPSQPIEIGRLERRSDKLQAVYDLGTGDAEASLGSLRTYLAQG